MKRFDTLKLKLIKRRQEKLEYEAYKRHKKYERDALDFILEECDRANRRTEATINYFNNEVKEK